MIRLENVVLRKNNHIILDNASITIQSAKFTGLKIEKGSGASSVFKLFAGLMRPTRGQVFIDSQEINKLKDHQVSWLRSRRIGLIYDTPSLVNDLTVFENIVMPLKIIGMPKYRRIARVNEIAQEFGIFDILHKKIHQIDKGMQQIVAICRALSTDPDIIIADSPASLLSAEESEHLFTILKELAKYKNRTVICVTHDDTVDEYADRIVNINKKNFKIQERIKEQRFDDYKGIQRARYPLSDKLHHAWNTITRNALVNSMLLLLISIGMAISLSATNITESSWSNLQDDIDSSLDTRQIDVDKGGTGVAKTMFSVADQDVLDGIISQGLAASYYDNYNYTMHTASVIPYDYDTLTSITNMVDGTPTGILGTRIEDEWLVWDNGDARVSTLPAHQADVDATALAPSLSASYQSEYDNNSKFWNNIDDLLVHGNLPRFTTDEDEQDWVYKFNDSTPTAGTIGEIMITEEFAESLLTEAIKNGDDDLNTAFSSIQDLPGMFMTFSFSYDDPLNAWEDENNVTIPVDDREIYNRTGTRSSSTILKVAGIVSQEIIPGSPIYMQKHVNTINQLLMQREYTELYSQHPSLSLADFESFYGVYDYSLVNKDTATMSQLVEKIKYNTNLRIVGRDSIINIVKSATDVSNIIVAVSWILLAIMIISLTIIFSTFLLELKEETKIMRSIGMTKLSTISNNIFVALLISLIVNSVANVLFILFLVSWNFISSGETVSINWAISYDMWIYGTVGFILLSFIPTYRSASIQVKT